MSNTQTTHMDRLDDELVKGVSAALDIARLNSAQAIPFEDIQVGEHYMIDSANPPIVSTHPELYIWKVIGIRGRHVLAVPAYSFYKGAFVDSEFPKVGSFNAQPAKSYRGEELEVVSFYDAKDIVKDIEARAERSGNPRSV